MGEPSGEEVQPAADDEWVPVDLGKPSRLLQTVPAHKPGEGAVGDCYRTAIACLLGAPNPEWVPHFAEPTMGVEHKGGWHMLRLARLWLRPQSLDIGEVYLDCAIGLGLPYLLTVKSQTGEWNHTVIARGEQVIHDPSGRTYTFDERAGDTADIIVRPYNPDPDEQLRTWARLQVEEDIALVDAAALSGRTGDVQ